MASTVRRKRLLLYFRRTEKY